MGVCNALAAGIFLAAGLVHLFSEAIELFESLYEIHIVNPAFLLAPVGFFLTFAIDKVLFLKEEDPHKEKHPKKVFLFFFHLKYFEISLFAYFSL